MANLASIAANAGRVGVVVWSAEARSETGVAFRALLPEDPEGYAHGIFAALHEADEASLDVLVLERVPDSPAWWAVADRLRRAAEK